jgi:Tfp pilus assembly protein PilX
LPQDLLQARLSKKLLDADFLLAKASKLLRALEQALEKAQQTGTTTLVLAAAREIRPTLELLAKFSTKSKTTTEQPDIRITAEFSGLRTAILDALQPYPEARVAAAAALSMQIEAGK